MTSTKALSAESQPDLELELTRRCLQETWPLRHAHPDIRLTVRSEIAELQTSKLKAALTR